MNSIFQYIDYRAYLRDYYHSLKKQDPQITFGVLARKIGFASRSFLKLVMDGKRNLGIESLQNISDAIGLKKKESEYFSYLVFFDQAKKTVEKNYYFGLISAFRSRSNIAAIHADQYEYYAQWYNPVIRELIKGKGPDIDCEALARQVRPAILPKQVKKSIRLLENLGMIKKNDQGKYEHASTLLSTEREVKSLAVRNYHKEILEVATDALENIPQEERDISALTVRISPQGFEKIKKRMQNFRDELMQIVKEDQNVNQVHQINFQFFPVAKPDVKEGS